MSTKEKKPSTEEKFASLCTFPFDPNKASDCYKVCKIDNPEDFKACEENYKITPIKPKSTTKVAGGRGKSHWGHINNTQAGLIDDCMVESKKPQTLDEVCAFSGGQRPRVLAHLKYLVTKKGSEINLTKDSCIFYPENLNMKDLKSFGSVTTLSIKKKKAAPVEKKEDPAPEKKKETPAKKEEAPAKKKGAKNKK